ncbi:MAG: tyrosine-type recombinase/integrase [Candidatus Dormiibacterota bacterium]
MTRRGHGEGSIRHRADGRWEASLQVEGRRRSWLGKTRTEVAQKLSVAIHAHETGAPLSGPRQTFARFWANWLPGMQTQLRPRTWQLYDQVGRTHLLPAFGRVPLAQLGPEHIRALHASMLAAGLSPSTVRHAHMVAHRCLADAVRWGTLARNPVGLVSPPRMVEQEMQTFSAEQARRLLEAAQGDRFEALYVLAVTTGLRQGELLALRWRDVDLEQERLAVTATLQSGVGALTIAEPKTLSSRRQVALTSQAVEALRRHRQAQVAERLAVGPLWQNADLVFPNTIGGPMERRNLLRREFGPLLRRAGLPTVRFHDLRHTAATLLLAQGVHPKIAQEMLGHANIAITLDCYSHVSQGMQKEAARAMSALFGEAPATPSG